MKRVIVTILFILILLLVGLLWQEGMFNKVEIETKAMGPYILVYRDYVGPYNQVGPVIDEVYQELLIDGVTATQSAGLYFDNPNQTNKKELHSQVGMIVPADQKDNLSIVTSRYNIKNIGAQDSLVATFPYHNKMSIMLGAFKVYPKLKEQATKLGKDIEVTLEIYDKHQQTIYYIVGIN